MSAHQSKHDIAEAAMAKEWQDPSLGPKEGKTHQAMLERREAISRHVAAGGEQPRNVDPIEQAAMRRRREALPPLVLPTGKEIIERVRAQQQAPREPGFEPYAVACGGPQSERTERALDGIAKAAAAVLEDRRIAALGGKPADERAQGLVECTGCAAPDVLTVDEIARRGRIGQALELFSALGDDDQRVWLHMLRDGGNFAGLMSRCVALKNELAEPALNADGSLPANPMIATPREHVALAELLGALKAYRRILLPHPKTCECKGCKATP